MMIDAIESMVSLDFTYSEIATSGDNIPETYIRVDGEAPVGAQRAAWMRARADWPTIQEAGRQSSLCSTPKSPMRVARFSLSNEDLQGSVWFGSTAPNFPDLGQITLLSAAASLTATGLIGARISRENQRASIAKDEFLAMLAHELRNPLSPIKSASEMLSFGTLDAAALQRIGKIIGRQVGHMAGLIDDLLDVSRVTRGIVTLSKRPLNLKEVVADAIEQIRPQLALKRHHLSTHIADQDLFVLGDKKRLVQVVANLLGNAVKYTPPNGNISISLETHEDQVVMVVSDDGLGMSDFLIKNAFDLFAQGERALDRSQGGLGIGLALVKSLVLLHRGSISATSAGLGLGSHFTMVLPMLHTTCAETSVAVVLLEQSEVALRILIVDDNIDAADMLAMLLTSHGHEVRIEHGSVAAYASSLLTDTDVFLLDLGLPGMDGLELVRRLRKTSRNASRIMIAITGYGQPQDKENALKAGFDHHFVKPVETTELIKLLTRIKCGDRDLV